MRCKCVPWVPSVPWSVNTTPFADEAPRIRADLRERIATACLVELVAWRGVAGNADDLSDAAIKLADALIARLEAKP
jgi:hypothetical protein